jgi:trans-aconitate 2-methyltransferase
MAAGAAERLRAHRDRVGCVVADLGRGLPFAAVFDAVLSTATFHWVLDHEALFAGLAAVLRPGGRLVAQCGGVGNIASVVTAARSVAPDFVNPVNFATPEETRRRLAAAGFVESEAWLTEEPAAFASVELLESFLATVILGAHLERLGPDERAGFVHAVAQALPQPEIDYVRLNLVARRPPA